ncbi:non-functional NADPH-dependent codeinone reductase 2 [Cinnamomum micranthum f. kanehirae]|uniref:Non-functional NADPH-dependent codeinone reductase 2 n=1 Tax=Cinnamomum micranthum f. kanehirae TaxID=337451 RepID=A0A443NM14_9MAGN|nr:non-functional NADPH-dependent codeinone reductase 2 [Cinnamomum micranthum f. kanehirae]
MELNIIITSKTKKLRDLCASKGIYVTAYSPLGAKGTTWGGSHVMESEVLKEIAEARGKTVAQVFKEGFSGWDF